MQCKCKRGKQRDNCPSCEGTGFVVDFAEIRAHVRKNLEQKRQNYSPESDWTRSLIKEY